MTVCREEGCEREAAVRVFVPWAEDRELCPAHARSLATQDGVVAQPLAGKETEWP